jgi:hypothetical protein
MIFHELCSQVNSYKSLSGAEFNLLLKDIHSLTDEKKLQLMELTDTLDEDLCYVREACDSNADIMRWKKLCRRMNRIEQIIMPALDRAIEKDASKTKWDILREMDSEILVHYRDTILNDVKSLSDDEKKEESIFITKLLNERSA